ncbi:LytR/AlgR family response regulator transcription factor [Aliagarivorans marinus]|uniref:LytR/AlgR family response regulator transcription factor n=1 Tax=Aliagarivorans marinus TaxID=561965 RepID=UPI0003F73430|nr:LytTR family DNA-binding domain-containing protein [Aliagarivorans marinus]
MQAIIVDDEPLLRFHLDKMLGECWPELEVVDKAGDGDSALNSISQLKPDVVFLDIRMPGLNGIELAEKLNQLDTPPAIVFTTAFDEYAIQAFEQQAIDYLLKPIEEQRLLGCCQRVKQRLQHTDAPVDIDYQALSQALNPQTSSLRWIKAGKGEDVELVATSEVLAFVAEDKYTTVHTQSADYVIRTPLKELVKQLDPDQFWQIHRATLVQVAKIQRVKRSMLGKLSVELIDGKEFAVSRSANHLFKAM